MQPAGDPNDLLLRLMSASTLRARVIADNIANQNVPGYKRQVVRFEDLLREKLEHGSSSLEDVEPKIETDRATPASADGNNVDLELETNASRENWLLYQTYAAILQSRNEMLRASISEGR
jgi:flagellar basal-body rod protein FlgB